MRKKILSFFRNATDLREGTNVKGTIDSIRKNIAIRGYNVWILAAAAMIASIGLDMNSGAVIIGAMLISPLMSPILGVGLSIGINDRETLIHSLENLSVAVVASVAMSTLYFWITPFGDFTPQIEARTKPTLLDVAVGFFGGVAGIVSTSRKEVTNAIPGVAIATALMPPLCVSGYGIAMMKWEIFFGAFYLFFLNAIFIALSTYLIVRYLNFPFIDFIDAKNRRRVTRWMAFFVIIMIIPSGYLLYTVLKDIRTEDRVTQFIDDQINDAEHRALDHTYIKGNPDTLMIIVDGSTYIDTVEQNVLRDALSAYNLDDCYLDLRQMIAKEVDLDAFATRQENRFKQMLLGKEQIIDDRERRIESLQSKMDSMRRDAFGFDRISRELKIIYPNLENISVSDAEITDFKGKTTTIPLVVVDWKTTRRTTNSSLKRKENQLGELLRQRLDLDTIKVVRE